MKIFTWKKAAAGAALLSLFACGDDSSSSSKTPDIFSTKDDLPECTEKIAGDTLYVESDSADYFCDDGEWVIVGDTTATDTTATDSLSSYSIADSLLSSSSVEVSSSSANPREVVGACPDTITGNSIYVDGDSLVLESYEQFDYSAYIGNAILLDPNYLSFLGELSMTNTILGNTTLLCSVETEDSLMCPMARKGGHFSANFDSAKAYGPWLNLRLKMLNTSENKKEILLYAESRELCAMGSVNLYGCLGKNGNDVNAVLEYAQATDELRLDFGFNGAAKYSTDSAAALKITLANIESAISDGDFTKVAALTGLKASDP